MKSKHLLFKITSIIVLLTLGLGVAVGLPARAMQTSPDAAPPAGLSADDWTEIQSLIPTSLPSHQAYLKASNTGEYDWFGWSVAVSGNTVVVGAYNEDSSSTGVGGNQGNNSAADSGAAYVFFNNGNYWSQQAYLKASNTGADDRFGNSVAISGDTIVVGAYREDSNAVGVNGDQANNLALDSGAAYVFVRSGTTWSQQTYLKASNTGASDWFGYSVSISGDTMVVGAVGEASGTIGVNGNQGDNSAFASGAAYVFVRSGTTWSQQAYLKASNTEVYDNFAYSVAISGETIVVGAGGEDSSATGINGSQSDNSVDGSGAAYVFTRSGTTWSQQAYLKASNTGDSDWFGSSVAIYGNTAVVGAYQESSSATGVNGDQNDNSAISAGAVYVFTRSGTTWSQQAYIKASNTDGHDYFGNWVAISRDTIVVGAPFESSNAKVVNGDQTNNLAPSAGAAYIFARSGTTWSQQAYVKASNADAGDEFGTSVAIDGDLLVVGAYMEDSNAAGVNGDQNDNSAIYAGAGYVYLQKHTLTFKSVGSYDGNILESNETSNVGGSVDATSTTFKLGDEVGDRQYRAILSFNTAALPDTAVFTQITLKIRKQALVGTNPFAILGYLYGQIRKPNFGTSLALVMSDFQAAPSVSHYAICFDTPPVNGWYSGGMGLNVVNYLNKTGTTQFRLFFSRDDNDDLNADYMKFYSGNYAYAASRPTLIIEYYIP